MDLIVAVLNHEAVVGAIALFVAGALALLGKRLGIDLSPAEVSQLREAAVEAVHVAEKRVPDHIGATDTVKRLRHTAAVEHIAAVVPRAAKKASRKKGGQLLDDLVHGAYRAVNKSGLVGKVAGLL